MRLIEFVNRSETFVHWRLTVPGQVEDQEVLGTVCCGEDTAKFNLADQIVTFPNVTVVVTEVDGGFDVIGQGVQFSLRRK